MVLNCGLIEPNFGCVMLSDNNSLKYKLISQARLSCGKMERTREHFDNIAARFRQLDVEIRELEKFADKAIRELKADYQQQINELFLKKAEVQNKVSKVQKAGEDAWEDMKAGNELSWEAFEESVKSRIKKKK